MIAVLGMYPFAHVSADHQALWAAVCSRIDGAADCVLEQGDPHPSWRRDDLLLGQTCGWPLVTQLRNDVCVVGRFDMDVPFAHDGLYRTVLIASKPLDVGEWRANPGTVCAIKDRNSRSGWVSMQWAWGGEPIHVLETGAHAESLRAVAEGRAHVASIDAVTWEHLTVARRPLVGAVHVIGHGPLVPTLPLITAPAFAHRVDEIRAALSAAVSDPTLASALRRLHIRGFIASDYADYQHLPDLLPSG